MRVANPANQVSQPLKLPKFLTSRHDGQQKTCCRQPITAMDKWLMTKMVTKRAATYGIQSLNWRGCLLTNGNSFTRSRDELART